jgi:hypothetical protein
MKIITDDIFAAGEIYFVLCTITMKNGMVIKDTQPFLIENQDRFLNRQSTKHKLKEPEIKKIELKKLSFLSVKV